ncbi:hypothetical protein [Tenacibaculum aiptasiae]|uniref:hypothetical protein n=1 Tax=Tenacibaculum aiptasiae TaxID=426481 RepID=UPI00158825AC|nr:hypothetical protein [Tenacibaculum aiptasiae]
MKKSILNIGKTINKSTLKTITGGHPHHKREPDYCDEIVEMSRELCLCTFFGDCN